MSEPTPKQLHVREIADFTADGDRVVTRKYVLLDDYERLTRERDAMRGERDAFRAGLDRVSITSLSLDNDRLRAALRQIVDIETEYESCAELAREALEP